MSPGKPTTLKVRGTNRHWFVLRIMAYITVENEIEPEPVGSTSSRNLLEMQVLGLHLRFSESETLQVGPKKLLFNKPFK